VVFFSPLKGAKINREEFREEWGRFLRAMLLFYALKGRFSKANIGK